jgi:hypothetical protein
MREWLGPLLPGSLLILDEAPHAAPSSGGRYGIETKFTRAIRDLGGRFEHRLFLSATPHNGHSNSFSTLLELLEPYRFTRGVKVRGTATALNHTLGVLSKVMVFAWDIGVLEKLFWRLKTVKVKTTTPEMEYYDFAEYAALVAAAQRRAATTSRSYFSAVMPGFGAVKSLRWNGRTWLLRMQC